MSDDFIDAPDLADDDAGLEADDDDGQSEDMTATDDDPVETEKADDAQPALPDAAPAQQPAAPAQQPAAPAQQPPAAAGQPPAPDAAPAKQPAAPEAAPAQQPAAPAQQPAAPAQQPAGPAQQPAAPAQQPAAPAQQPAAAVGSTGAATPSKAKPHLFLRLIGALIAAVIIGLYFNLWFAKEPLLKAPGPYVGGILVLVMLYALYVVLTGDFKIWDVALGADGRASTSKFQMLLWLSVVLFGYVVVMTSRVQMGHPEPLQEIPPNILLALGLSIGTATVAKAATSGNAENMRDVKAMADVPLGPAPLVQGDDGRPDLAKIQLLAWTVVAIGVYLNLLVSNVNHGIAAAIPPELPDIDPTLLILMGIGSGAYLGRKLITTATPFITSITSNTAAPGDELAITGANFGTAGRLMLGNGELQAGVTSWSDTRIVFNAPAPDANRGWTASKPLELSVQGTTGPSANTIRLTLTPKE